MSLSINSIISIEISSGIESTSNDIAGSFSSYFTTTMSPLYANANDIRKVAGNYVATLSDDILNQLSLENSLLIEDLSSCERLPSWYTYANRWSTYKSAITAIYNSPLLSGTSGKVYKQLGDFSITKDGTNSSADISKLIDRLDCEMFKFEVALRTCGVPAITCTDRADVLASYETPSAMQLVERGEVNPNKPLPGRTWMTQTPGETRGNSLLINFGRLYKTNVGRAY